MTTRPLTGPKPAARPNLGRVKFSFALIYFLFMSARAVFGPFITIYLTEKGLSTEMIGVVTGINSFVIILSQPLWGVIADKFGSVKRTLIVLILAQAVFALSLMAASDALLIAVCFSIYTMFSSAEGPLLDSWSLRSIKQAGDANAMGQLKLWGCIGFSLCSVLSGLFITAHSASAIIPIFSCVLLLTAVAIRFVKAPSEGQGRASIKELGLGRILRHREFLVFLLFIFVMQLAHRASYTFYPLLIVQLGGDSSMVGYASALMFVSEAIIMFFSKRLLSRFKPQMLVIASAFSFMLWHVMLRAASNPWHVMLSCIMDGPSFAMFTMGTLYYLDELAPKELRTTYQTIAYSVYFGLSGVVGNVVGGFLIDRLGYRQMYNIGIIVTFTATALFYLGLRLKQRRAASSGKDHAL